MPTLFRLLSVLAVIGGLVWGAMYLLASYGEPSVREITITLPAEKLKGK